ncbi:MAG: 16S rRNA (cytidine(1402)-2'-O)-methyltransferase, partial [Campylobacterales bacterium]|nr:16S rRNA (cytidine(1402)-2'-O)-methyltransferase [Campylobacterales bacterium]
AVITALAASGLSTRRFLFEGFLDRQKKARRERLDYLKKIKETIIFYESPHRLLETLKELEKTFGNRQITVARELTKRYEEYHRASISETAEYFANKGVKGEFVLLMEGNLEEEVVEFSYTIEEHLLMYMDQGHTKKEAISLVAKERKLPKKEVYNIAIDIKK